MCHGFGYGFAGGFETIGWLGFAVQALMFGLLAALIIAGIRYFVKKTNGA
jgi:hypothetical protein